jgi:hydroxymethylglutaryl-CoA lyase
VIVSEVGPRDGLQMVHAVVPTQTKNRWIAALAAAGLPEIEVGSFVPLKLVPQMADAAEVTRFARTLPGLQVAVLAPNLKGFQAAHAAGAQKITLPVSVSEAHSMANTRKPRAAQIEEARRIGEWLRTLPANERPVFEAACATAFGCSLQGKVEEREVVETAVALAAAGADFVGLSDTAGYANPAQVRRLVRAVRAEVGGRLENLHMHDTMGLGLANVAVGVEEGIRCFDGALAGLGGCPFAPGASGNIVTEDLVFLLESLGLRTGVDLDALTAARAILREALPEEPMHGAFARAGRPTGWRAAA